METFGELKKSWSGGSLPQREVTSAQVAEARACLSEIVNARSDDATVLAMRCVQLDREVAALKKLGTKLFGRTADVSTKYRALRETVTEQDEKEMA